MRKKVILITGASGEIGQALVNALSKQSDMPIITLDIAPIPEDIRSQVIALQGDIMDKALLSRLVSEYEVDTIYHLAALLSLHQLPICHFFYLRFLQKHFSEWKYRI